MDSFEYSKSSPRRWTCRASSSTVFWSEESSKKRKGTLHEMFNIRPVLFICYHYRKSQKRYQNRSGSRGKRSKLIIKILMTTTRMRMEMTTSMMTVHALQVSLFNSFFTFWLEMNKSSILYLLSSSLARPHTRSFTNVIYSFVSIFCHFPVWIGWRNKIPFTSKWPDGDCRF